MGQYLAQHHFQFLVLPGDLSEQGGIQSGQHLIVERVIVFLRRSRQVQVQLLRYANRGLDVTLLFWLLNGWFEHHPIFSRCGNCTVDMLSN